MCIESYRKKIHDRKKDTTNELAIFVYETLIDSGVYSAGTSSSAVKHSHQGIPFSAISLVDDNLVLSPPLEPQTRKRIALTEAKAENNFFRPLRQIMD